MTRQLTRTHLKMLLLLLLLVLLVGVLPSLWGGGASKEDVGNALTGPSHSYWLGTDELGRDVLSRTLVAARTSVAMALTATVVGAFAGISLGSLAGVLGAKGGRYLSGVISLFLAFPALLLALFFAVVFGIGSIGAVLAIGAAFAPGFARLTQTSAASVADREFIDASRLLGKNRLHIILKHILPNIAEPLLIYGTIHVGTAILAISGLGFLGFGPQPPQYDWGALLSKGIDRLYVNPAIALAPAVAITIAGLAFNFLGEFLSDIVSGRHGEARFNEEESIRVRREYGVQELSRTGANSQRVGSRDGSVLDIDGLHVQIPSRETISTPVRDVSLRVATGESLGIVGESGSGKTVASLAVAELLERPLRGFARHVERFGQPGHVEMSKQYPRATINRTSVVFQEPGGTFNPTVKIGTQIREPARVSLGLSRSGARKAAIEGLQAVGIDDSGRRYDQYEHELSGGMKQRASIAGALINNPTLLIADEPTTALDVTVQRKVLDLLVNAGNDSDERSLVLISHDVAVVAQVCSRVVVMYAGFVVEEGSTDEVLRLPAHPYTRALIAATPDMSTPKSEALYALGGRVPEPTESLNGCYFAPRCPKADDLCRTQRPTLEPIAGRSQQVACWYPENETRSLDNSYE